MITFTYQIYLPIAILTGSALLALLIGVHLPSWVSRVRSVECGVWNKKHRLSSIAWRRASGVQSALRTPHSALRWLTPGVVLAVAMVVYAATFSTFLVMRHQAFWTFSFDLGIFDQATWLIGHGKVPFMTLRGLHVFGDHASFILVLIAPLYYLFDSPITLLVLESCAIALGALPLYLIARLMLPGLGAEQSWL